MGSYYDVLGLRPKATDSEIRSAYARDLLGLQKALTPEGQRFRAVLDEAFATLIDPGRRSAYDADLRRPKPKPQKPPKAAKVPKAPKPPKPPTPPKAEKPPQTKAPEVKPPKITKAPVLRAEPRRLVLPRFGSLRRLVQSRSNDANSAIAAPAVNAPTTATPSTIDKVTKPPKSAVKKTSKIAAVRANPEQQAWGYARNGGLAFALGGLTSALVFLFSSGPLILAWIPLVAGIVGLAWWGVRYVRLPRAAWRPDHLLVLGGLVMFGVVSAGWVTLP